MNAVIKKRYVNKITDIEIKNRLREQKIENELINEFSCHTDKPKITTKTIINTSNGSNSPDNFMTSN